MIQRIRRSRKENSSDADRMNPSGHRDGVYATVAVICKPVGNAARIDA
ncbi:hypothetical protein [Crateriforma conspicua]|nr:hypothetical protein [Crateriforma conspicua]